jgi:hypothetical protein
VTPGSTMAYAAGCICPVLENNYGTGIAPMHRPGIFTINQKCAIHGIARWTPARIRAPADASIAARIEALKSPDGGWSKEALASLGVPWPPPKGWKEELIAKEKKQC